jgi:hypothetical protein
MQVKDLTVEQLQTLIRNTVDERLDEYFADPDQGKEIKESFMHSLLNIRKIGQREDLLFQHQKCTKDME